MVVRPTRGRLLRRRVGVYGWAKPYGYYGFGELFVFVFFGLVATAGSAYVQHAPFMWVFQGTVFSMPFDWGFALWAGVPVGLLAAALLQANNLRDIDTDTESGKRTLAVRLGRRRAGLLYCYTLMAVALSIGVLYGYRSWALLALLATPLAVGPVRLRWATARGDASCRCSPRNGAPPAGGRHPPDHRAVGVRAQPAPVGPAAPSQCSTTRPA